MSRRAVSGWLLASLVLVSLTGCGGSGGSQAAASSSSADKKVPPKAIELLNVSYDPTRELWRELNEAFIKDYTATSGGELTIKQSHGGSSSQARSVIDGLEADVVTLAMWNDVDAIRKAGLVAEDWESSLPNRALPYVSTIVFVVRKGNPKQIKDWADLIKGDTKIITPSPKTSGNGKLSFLAAWGAVLKNGGSEADAEKFVTELYSRVPVLDSGARGSTTTFAQKGIGDVHLTWENEAYLEVEEAKGELEIVFPTISIRAEPPVAVVSGNTKRKGSQAAAEAYLKYLYTPAGQAIIAKHHYRPTNEKVLAEHAKNFPSIKLFAVTDVAKDWADAQAKYFAEGTVFDRVYKPAK